MKTTTTIRAGDAGAGRARSYGILVRLTLATGALALAPMLIGGPPAQPTAAPAFDFA